MDPSGLAPDPGVATQITTQTNAANQILKDGVVRDPAPSPTPPAPVPQTRNTGRSLAELQRANARARQNITWAAIQASLARDAALKQRLAKLPPPPRPIPYPNLPPLSPTQTTFTCAQARKLILDLFGNTAEAWKIIQTLGYGR